MKNVKRSLLVLAAMAVLPVWADDALTSGVSGPAQEGPKVGFNATASVSQQVNTDIDDGGSFSVFRGRIALGVPVRLNESWGLDTGFSYQFDAYDFSKSFDPWGTINTLQVTEMLKWKMNEKWVLYGGGLARFSVENSTDLNKGFTAGGLVGFNFTVNEKLSLGAGVAYVGQVEDDSQVIPILTANWKINDAWKLKAGFTDVATTGYGIEASWAMKEKWSLDFGAQFHKNRFRLDEGGVNPKGVGQENSTMPYVRLNWAPKEHIGLTGFVGLAAGGNLRVEDKNGHKLAESDYDTALVLGGQASLRF